MWIIVNYFRALRGTTAVPSDFQSHRQKHCLEVKKIDSSRSVSALDSGCGSPVCSNNASSAKLIGLSTCFIS